jgi:hypothetical protein
MIIFFSQQKLNKNSKKRPGNCRTYFSDYCGRKEEPSDLGNKIIKMQGMFS